MVTEPLTCSNINSMPNTSTPAASETIRLQMAAGECLTLTTPTLAIRHPDAPFEPFIEPPQGVRVLQRLPLDWEGGWGCHYQVSADQAVDADLTLGLNSISRT